MSAWLIFLFTLYAIELAVLLSGVYYVFRLWLTRQTFVNPHLSGTRLKWAAIIPIGWFIYIYTDAYAVYKLCVASHWIVSETAIKQKALRQLLSLVIGMINTAVLTGFKIDFNK